MSNLEIKQLTINRADTVAPLYAACFGEGQNPSEGWGERAACWEKTCLADDRGTIIPYVELGTPCPRCNTPMTEAYPLEWTTNYIETELSYPGTIALLGIINGFVAAAVWGYEGEISQIAKKKYPGNPIMVSKVVKAYNRISPLDSKTSHISEIFVEPSFRGKDYAQELVARMIQSSKYPITSRTLNTSPMKTVFEKAGLKQILIPGTDPDNRQRVVYASSNN